MWYLQRTLMEITGNHKYLFIFDAVHCCKEMFSLLNELDSDLGVELFFLAYLASFLGSSWLFTLMRFLFHFWKFCLSEFTVFNFGIFFTKFRMMLFSFVFDFVMSWKFLANLCLLAKTFFTGGTVFKLAYYFPFEVPQRKTQSGCFDLDSSLLQLKCLSARRYILFTRNFETFFFLEMEHTYISVCNSKHISKYEIWV